VRLGRSADVTRIARASGHDFVFVDAQHGLFDVESIGHIAQPALSGGIDCLVRVIDVDAPDVPLLLDGGATGVVFPNVETAEEASRAVSRVRFPPLGSRSVTGGYPHVDYQSVPLEEMLAHLNANTLVVCMVETPKGVANVDAIAAVPGVDCVLLGASDLLVSLDMPGQFDSPELGEAIDATVAAARAYGKAAGCGGNRSVERQAALVRKGITVLTTSSDIELLLSAGRSWTEAVRSSAG
jgi:staphyloferrin B biosynthesis citrate synthase